MAALTYAADQYVRQLWAIANQLTLTRADYGAKVNAWAVAARASGVQEANIIAYLRGWDLWDGSAAQLADITIPLEIQRVQAGGIVGSTDTTPYKMGNPPPIPDTGALIEVQGGPKTGASQYSGSISPVPSPKVEIAGVLTSTSFGVTNAVDGPIPPDPNTLPLPPDVDPRAPTAPTADEIAATWTAPPTDLDKRPPWLLLAIALGAVALLFF